MGTELIEALPKDAGHEQALDGLVVAGSYRISRLLGRGSMGDVYEAEHVRLGSAVAVKLMRASRGDGLRSAERFRREARRIATLRSDQIVRVFDYGELADGTPYLVMERLIGEDLRSLLKREGPLPVRRAVKLLTDVCRGLSVVHRARLVHRDLKPANLFVEALEVGGETCKILDFGVVKAPASESTHQGALIGTIRYMAPEQLEDASAATLRSDVYAIGAILYECLCGVAANAGETLQDTMFHILHRDPRRPSEVRAIPSELEAVVLRALSRDPSARYGSAEELRRALSPFGVVERAPRQLEALDEDTLDAGMPSTHDGRTRKPSRRAIWTTLLVALSSVGLGGATGWILRGAERTARAGTAEPLHVAGTPHVPSHPVSAPPRVPVASAGPSSSAVVVPQLTEPSAVVPAQRARRAVPARPPASDRVKLPAAPSATSTAARIAGRFDPSDPYE